MDTNVKSSRFQTLVNILGSRAIHHEGLCVLSLDMKQWNYQQSKTIIATLSKVIEELKLVNYDKLTIDDDMCDTLTNLKKIDVIDTCIGCDEEEVKIVKNKLPNVEIQGTVNALPESDWNENGFKVGEINNGRKPVTAVSSNKFKNFAYSFTKIYKKIRLVIK
jgi:hypothetical protein